MKPVKATSQKIKSHTSSGRQFAMMSNLSEISQAAERNVRTSSSEDARNHFKYRTLNSDRKFTLPRRYVMALLLCILSILETLRGWKALLALNDAYHSRKKETDYPAFENWTHDDFNKCFLAIAVGDIFLKILGGLLIYRFSSHKFLLVSVAVSSILHILTPTAVSHHSLAFALIVMVGQEISSVSVFTAVLSMWKDWAPLDERSVLLTISLLGAATAMIGHLLSFLYVDDTEGISTYIGIAGIIWVLIWNNFTSSTPQCDPWITEREYFYLQSKIQTNYQEKTSLKDVPWLSMAKCKQVIILFLVFFKLACSKECLIRSGVWIILFYPERNLGYIGMTEELQKIMIPFFVVFILVFFGSSIIMDILLKKYKDKALITRKTFLCTGFIMQGVFLMAAVIADGKFVRALFYALAYVFFALSWPGALRIPLDLAPRYVSITAGFGSAFYSLGLVCFVVFSFHTYDSEHKYQESRLFIVDLVVSLFTGIVFGIWGEVEERTWSFITPPRRRGNDYKSYPQPDDEDCIDLTPNA